MLHSVGFAIVVLGACRPESTLKPVGVVTTKTNTKSDADPELLRTLAVLATSQAPTPAELAATHKKVAAGELTLAAYIETLLASKGFTNDVAPLIVLRQFMSHNAFGAPIKGYMLQHTEGARPVYYLHAPCSPHKAVSVVPWWNLIEGRKDAVLICPDSYRPDQWVADLPKGQPEIACLSMMAPFQDPGHKLCGCGPNLMRCLRSPDHQFQLSQAIRDELQASVAHDAEADRPLEEIFTANASFRDRNAEYLMRSFEAASARHAISAASFRELAEWPATGKWAPRQDLAPGQNAGILTSPQIVHFTLDRRQRMTAINDVLWCIDPDSVGAQPEMLLSIVGTDIQLKDDGWKDLAARPICTNCHARLDYGFQFFWGFPNGNLQAFFTPALQKKGRGQLYVKDINDPRGEAELSPAGFAKLAIAQPEFKHCMARDFTEYALGNQITPEALAAVEAKIQPNKTSPRELMRVALGALVEHWPEHHGRAASVEPPLATRLYGPTISVTADLHGELVHCLDCHEHEPGRPDLSTTALDRRTVVGMLETVANGKMPKEHPLTEAERKQFLERFIAATWLGTDAATARAYFVDRSSALPAFRPEVTFALIHHVAHAASPTRWRMVENSARSDVQQVTPGFLAVTGLAAVESCRANYKARADLDRCIMEAMQTSNLTGQAPNP